jgi:hypothetical protein
MPKVSLCQAKTTGSEILINILPQQNLDTSKTRLVTYLKVFRGIIFPGNILSVNMPATTPYGTHSKFCQALIHFRKAKL